jgi:alginate O-acetyltransferase complex protein AlgI
MLFNSFGFALFLPFVLAVYFLLSHKAQNRFLLAASIFFYACWDWRFVFPLLFSTTIDYYVAVRLEKLILAGAPVQERNRWLTLSLVTNLGLLGFFKYFNFFAENMQSLLGNLGINASLNTLNIILPVGISFYTFQALSYTIDVYRGQLHANASFADFLLCVLYFPHLVAGPIQRANSLLPQVLEPRKVTVANVAEGMHLICWGFFKKVFIADNLSPIADRIFGMASPDGFTSLMGVYAFCIQIYCDFSGYTDIARGVAKLMGFEFMLNFNLPYFATNPQEFWTRWHISLSSWLRDYLYIPLGGNRGSEWRVRRNLMLTMIIGGFWHGAAWNFMLWGFYHGSLLVLHRGLKSWLDRVFAWPGTFGAAASFLFRWFVMFHLTCYGWLLFRATSFGQIRQMTLSFVDVWNVDAMLALTVLAYSLPLILVQLWQYTSGKLFFLDYAWFRPELRVVAYSIMAWFVFFRGGTPQSFIYFQF